MPMLGCHRKVSPCVRACVAGLFVNIDWLLISKPFFEQWQVYQRQSWQKESAGLQKYHYESLFVSSGRTGSAWNTKITTIAREIEVRKSGGMWQHWPPSEGASGRESAVQCAVRACGVRVICATSSNAHMCLTPIHPDMRKCPWVMSKFRGTKTLGI